MHRRISKDTITRYLGMCLVTGIDLDILRDFNRCHMHLQDGLAFAFTPSLLKSQCISSRQLQFAKSYGDCPQQEATYRKNLPYTTKKTKEICCTGGVLEALEFLIAQAARFELVTEEGKVVKARPRQLSDVVAGFVGWCP